MALFFNLAYLFLFCLGLGVWHFVAPGVLAGAVFFISAALFLRWRKAGLIEAKDGIIAAAFLMNLWYVLSSWGNVRQYDYFNFVMFADYFAQNGFFLNEPSGYLQSVYFQPPLWGAVAGVFMRWLEFDSVRFVSLFAVTGAGVVFWRMLELFEFKKEVKQWVFAAFCFFPIHGIMANLVNNDALVYFLMISAMWAGYLWYLNGSWRETLALSGILFLAGMVKFSGLMVVPAIGVLGLFKLLGAKDKFSGKLWGQFAFIGGAAVLGFAWGWFLLYFGLPLVPPPLNPEYQSMASYTLFERLFSLSFAGEPFVDVRVGEVEPNVWLSLVKTSLFGEWRWEGEMFAFIMYGIGILFAIISAGSFFSLLKYKIGKDFAFNGALIVLAFSVLSAWANFWLDYPYFCSTEFRYTAVLLPAALLWEANFLSKKSLPKAVNVALAGLVVLFIFAKFMLYLNTI